MSEREEVDRSHLEGIGDGCGCAEVWEHLSEGRAEEEPEESRSE
jgi:hypothetical protein